VIFFWRKRLGMQTMRVPVGRVPQIKHTCEGRKIPFIKNACNNLDEKKMKRIQKGQKLGLTKYQKLTS
jgi:plasmid replication initiation protein